MPRRKLINNDRAPTLHVTRTPRTWRKPFISVATAFLIQWKFAHPRRVTLQPEMWEYLIGVAEERRAGAGRRPGLVLAGVGQDGLNGPDDEEGRNGGESLKGDQPRGGEELSEAELAMFLIQLLVAGNETTRNLISAGLVALSTNPDQWAALWADRALVPVAVEELLRWTTPVISFMRTATRPCTIRGQAVAEGDPLLLIYSSANRDEEVFRRRRRPVPHRPCAQSTRELRVRAALLPRGRASPPGGPCRAGRALGSLRHYLARWRSRVHGQPRDRR